MASCGATKTALSARWQTSSQSAPSRGSSIRTRTLCAAAKCCCGRSAPLLPPMSLPPMVLRLFMRLFTALAPRKFLRNWADACGCCSKARAHSSTDQSRSPCTQTVSGHMYWKSTCKVYTCGVHVPGYARVSTRAVTLTLTC